MIRPLKICMTGFGNVGRGFCGLVQSRKAEISERYQYDVEFVGISTYSKGTLINKNGLDIEKVFCDYEKLNRFDASGEDYSRLGSIEMINECGADIFVELSPLSIKDGQPAISYIEEACKNGMHAITANKGPVAWDFKRLSNIFSGKGLKFLFETTVMDGTPIFNLYKECLRGNKIDRIKGILNGTSNYVLTRLENGASFDDAIKEAQKIGLAEADPSMDVDGMDGAAKICALANILMDADTNPGEVQIKSMRNITASDLKRAKQSGHKIKYICEAVKNEAAGGVKLSVEPRHLKTCDALCTVDGTSAAVTLFTDLAGELTIIQTDPGILQTAYGVYSDLLTLIKGL